jgi:tetratricopeptide (TPR) repeat protein
MLARHPWVVFGLFFLGGTLRAAAADPAGAPDGTALRLWQQGQEAMLRGDTDEAIGLYHQSLKLAPDLARNYLSLAAAHIEKGEDAQAAPNLAQYLHLEPAHLAVRAHYAELLFRLGRAEDACAEFEAFIVAVQDLDALARQHLVHCHSRLMEIAEGQSDEYGEHLNRGVGLYLLACERSQLPGPDTHLAIEGMLCQAAGELTLAHLQRPDEARPHWYLYLVWARLAQRQPAARCLRAADEAAPFTYLTPSEQRRLELAWRRSQAEGRNK